MTDTSIGDSGTWLTDRALIRVSGEDVRGFLQGLVTQDLAAVVPDAPQWAGLLTPQGKALFDFILWAEGEAILIDCEAAQREALLRRLTLYRLRRPIAIEPAEGGVHWSPVPGRGSLDPRLPALGHRWLGGAEGAAATGWKAHRLQLGVTEGAAELGQDKTLWLECNTDELNGVSFAKGCYVGQEVVSRMQHRGTARTRILAAAYPDTAPQPGTEITAGGKGLGTTGSAAGTRGLALVRIDRLGDALAAGETPRAGERPVTLERPAYATFAMPDVATSAAG